MAWQVNSELVKELGAWFLGRDDLVNRWGNLIPSYRALPGLRFFAPMSIVGASGQAVDLALGNSLTNNANPLFTYLGFAPLCLYNGSTQYHSIADNSAHDIIGNEAYISGTKQGLTIGMWVQADSLGATSIMFAKGTTTGNARAYGLSKLNTDNFRFFVSDNGTNTFTATDTGTFAVDTWYFVAGRFDPSTEVKLWVGSSAGLTSFTNTTSIPAALNNSATGLAIGAQADGTSFSNIRASMCFLCAQALDDYYIKALFEGTRKVFGL